MSNIHDFNNSGYLDGLKHKTPFFIFSKKKILHQYKEYKKYFPGAAIHYAIKANSEPEILKTLQETDCGFEVASLYEYELLKKAGVKANRVIYGTSVKPTAHIKKIFKYGVDRFAFDSLPELEKIAAAAPGARVYVRVIVNDSGSVFRFSEKFGTDVLNVIPWLTHAKELGLVPYGISFHVGSQASNPMAWSNAIKILKTTIKELHEKGIKIEVLNIGGGYPCLYDNTESDICLEEIAKNIYSEYNSLSVKPKLILEPGRGIIACTGVMVASVIGRVERKGTPWLFLDAGVYNGLFETMAYQGSTRYKINSIRSASDSGETLFALAGPTGDSPDIITHEALLPSDISVGDKIVIHDVGAYSVVVTSRFNGFPKPNVYLV